MADKTIHELTQISAVTQLSEFPMWDSVNNTTKKATLQQVKELIASGIVAGVSFIGTRAEYEVAKLIPSGQEGYIPSGSLVIITDENRTYVTSGTGSEQTLSLVARVMSAGDGITISSDDKIKADTVTFTGTRAEWEALSSSQKAKYNNVHTTDEELTDDVIAETMWENPNPTSQFTAQTVTFSKEIDNRYNYLTVYFSTSYNTTMETCVKFRIGKPSRMSDTNNLVVGNENYYYYLQNTRDISSSNRQSITFTASRSASNANGTWGIETNNMYCIPQKIVATIF